ncbi:zinc finger MYM-type protein 1 isoform X3 [Oryzias melastigma]|uniref:Zinc finger MYM-type protein 1-like n=1 Tax=Oryzias melastigma TaxID=30732 RepID=A0A3B3C8M6_ORYME|nr:zinc finger MYM-type protein 1 isoform X3 [Oryzias melastigma]
MNPLEDDDAMFLADMLLDECKAAKVPETEPSACMWAEQDEEGNPLPKRRRTVENRKRGSPKGALRQSVEPQQQAQASVGETISESSATEESAASRVVKGNIPGGEMQIQIVAVEGGVNVNRLCIGDHQPEEPSTASADARESVTAIPRDPADWPANLTDSDRMELVQRGPYEIQSGFNFPKNQDGRSCHHHYFFRKLSNGERIKRTWLMYSPKKDSLFCFCCKLFSQKSFKLRTGGGMTDWKNCTDILKMHQNSAEHTKNMCSWKDLETCVTKGQTLDKAELALIIAETRRWREVLTRLVAIIQSLAERNLALRGSTDRLNEADNGNFLKEVELMAQFDPVLKEHMALVEGGADHSSYLGETIQNELIDCISERILKSILSEISKSKYFSIILDCTPDLSHREQISLIIRIVALEGTPQIKEHFVGFLEAEETSEEGLSALVFKKLRELNIPFYNCRGQAYDNGTNTMGKNQGVQARLRQINPRALYVPSIAHTVKLVVSDAARSSADADAYFGYLQKLFNFFAASTSRWSILKNYVDTDLKLRLETRWETRVSSVAVVRFQPAKVRDALLELRESAADPDVLVEAQSLAEEVGSFRFSICSVVWNGILSKIQNVSKLLKSQNMEVDVAVDLLKQAEASLAAYRDDGFAAAQTCAKKMCEEMSEEAALKRKRLRNTQEQFSYEALDESMSDAMQKMEVSFFNLVVDKAIASLRERAEMMRKVAGKFSVLNNFTDLPALELEKQTNILCRTLTSGDWTDLNSEELLVEMKSFPPRPKTKMTMLEYLAFLEEKRLTEVYPNLWVALRIALTIPTTVASAERSFSKQKLLKTYLRSAMSQEHLNGLAIISINRDVAGEISYDETIDAFAARKARSLRF